VQAAVKLLMNYIISLEKVVIGGLGEMVN
jgi:hypothetical protein